MTPDKYKEFIRVFFFWINDNPDMQKISFNLGNPAHHYTFRIWNDKREVDLHRTNESLGKDHPEYYQTFFRIKFYSLFKILVAFSKFDMEKFIRSMFQERITAGKLNKHNCILIPMDSRGEYFNKYYTVKRKRSGQKIKLNPNLADLNSVFPLRPAEALFHQANCFVVYKYRKGCLIMNGTAFRFPGSKLHGERSFVYWSNKKRNEMGRISAEFITDIANKIEFYNKPQIMRFLNFHKK